MTAKSQKVRPTMEERFWAKVDKAGPCWLWTGLLFVSGGYGQFTIRYGLVVRAHRLAYELAIGPIPEGKIIRHTCDVRRCVNPAHLIPGTQKENAQDMARRGRQIFQASPEKISRGSKHWSAKLTEEDIPQIRGLRNQGLTLRAIANIYGVTEKSISDVVNRKTWTHVPQPEVGPTWGGVSKYKI